MCHGEKEVRQTPTPYGSLQRDAIFTWTGTGPPGEGGCFQVEQEPLQGRELLADGCEPRLGDHPVGRAPRQTGVAGQVSFLCPLSPPAGWEQRLSPACLGEREQQGDKHHQADWNPRVSHKCSILVSGIALTITKVCVGVGGWSR